MNAVVLEIGGMTCTSCAARIEKKLNRMPGVEASVNYATDSVAPDTALRPAASYRPAFAALYSVETVPL